MKALIRQENDIFVIHLKGKVDFDSTEPFRNTVLTHLKDQKVVFNLSDLSFVGSNGITPFIETLAELSNIHGSKVHFCNISSEFKRIFEASSIQGLKVFENESSAKISFYAVFQNSTSMPEMAYPSRDGSSSPEELTLDSEQGSEIELESTPD